MSEAQELARVESKIGLYPDFPKKGILFRDIMPIFSEPELLNILINVLCNRLGSIEFDIVLGIESRGFLLGPSVAMRLNKPFSPVRKKGKLPGKLFSVDYDLEYGSDSLEIQQDSLPKGSRCVILDDLIATGGSALAAKRLVEMGGSLVVGFAFIIELSHLGGRIKLGNTPIETLFTY